jgi:uncharacterized Ntn-hydrolase superfamily protein
LPTRISRPFEEFNGYPQMTLSIAAWDQTTGPFGAAISSSSISVASRCLHWRPGVGIALSQNITDPRLGQRMLSLLAEGVSVDDAVKATVQSTPYSQYRQLALVGVDAGGEAGPLHSAGLLIGGDVSWPIAELRIDWDDDPIAKLFAGWAVYEPQIGDYVTHALDPSEAPSYGVPGDL